MNARMLAQLDEKERVPFVQLADAYEAAALAETKCAEVLRKRFGASTEYTGGDDADETLRRALRVREGLALAKRYASGRLRK